MVNKEQYFRNVNEKFLDGDPISNIELDFLLKFYSSLVLELKLLGPHFHFAWREVLVRKTKLEDFKQARENK